MNAPTTFTPAIPADPKHMAAKRLELALAQIGGLAQMDSLAHAEDTARRQRVLAAMTPAERAAFARMCEGEVRNPCMSLDDWTGRSSYPGSVA